MFSRTLTALPMGLRAFSSAAEQIPSLERDVLLTNGKLGQLYQKFVKARPVVPGLFDPEVNKAIDSLDKDGLQKIFERRRKEVQQKPVNYMSLIKLPPKQPIAVPEPPSSGMLGDAVRAVFDHLEKNNATEAVLTDVAALVQLMDKSDFWKTLLHGHDHSTIARTLNKIFDNAKPHPVTRWFFDNLVQNEMVGSTEFFYNALSKMYKDKFGLVHGSATVARPLTQREFTELYGLVKSMFGAKNVLLTLDVHIDPTILGGLILKVDGGYSANFSVKADIAEVEKLLHNARAAQSSAGVAQVVNWPQGRPTQEQIDVLYQLTPKPLRPSPKNLGSEFTFTPNATKAKQEVDKEVVKRQHFYEWLAGVSHQA